MKKFEDMRRPELAEKNNDEYQNDKSLLAADHHSNLLPAYIHIYTSFEKLGVGSIDECKKKKYYTEMEAICIVHIIQSTTLSKSMRSISIF